MDPAAFQRHWRAHDYAYLIRRWKKVARQSGLQLRTYSKASGLELYLLENSRPVDGPAIYLSAGIHGDEVGATEGLLQWAETDLPGLARKAAFLIFPCLNPWGLINNSRFDGQGRDLNRTYHSNRPKPTRDHKTTLRGRQFDLAITCHEDYDACGTYVYEVQVRKPFWGEDLLQATTAFLPLESRRVIEGRRCRQGVVRRRISPEMMPEFPEAFILHYHHAARTFTVETPSELALPLRAKAQCAFIRAAIEKVFQEFTWAKT